MPIHHQPLDISFGQGDITILPGIDQEFGMGILNISDKGCLNTCERSSIILEFNNKEEIDKLINALGDVSAALDFWNQLSPVEKDLHVDEFGDIRYLDQIDL